MLADESGLMTGGAFEDQIQVFEVARRTSAGADWYEFGLRFPNSQNSANLDLLCELAAIDLELSWKRGHGRQVEDYLARESRLNQFTFLIVLIAEEYRARLRRDKLTHDEFRQRFPSVGELIESSLREVDREQADEKRGLATGSSDSYFKCAATGSAPDSRATLVYNDFLLERFIGGGGSGKVYLAYQHSADRHLAVKFLKKSFRYRPDVIERFVAEAQTVTKLSHPRIIRLHGLGTTPLGGYFVAMDWLPAGDLNHQIELGAISVEKAARWLRDAANAIQYAHEQGVIHCDLKPANLLLDGSGMITVTDFGLARSIAQVDHELRGLEGTAGYMAPEQATSAWGPISTRTDIYGLGAILYALLTGRAPYRGSRPSDILCQLIGNKTIPSVESQRSDIPGELVELCRACLSHDPLGRPSSAKEVAERSALVG